MRVVAFDVGLRRTGVAISDATGTLARPWRTLQGGDASPKRVTELIHSMMEDADGLETVVIGLPRRLDGSPTTLTAHVMDFAGDVRARCRVPVVLQDERLSSIEADQRLAVRDRNWRTRKQKLDAATAAVILQDYLDQRARDRVAGAGPASDAPETAPAADLPHAR